MLKDIITVWKSMQYLAWELSSSRKTDYLTGYLILFIILTFHFSPVQQRKVGTDY